MRAQFLLLIFCWLLAFPGAGTAAPPGKGRLGAQTAENVIVAAVPANWPPQYSLDKYGNPAGFAIDVLDHLAAQLGFTVQYKIAPNFTRAVDMLEAGKADLVPNSGIVAGRLTNSLFTPPVETFRVVVFVRRGNVAVTGGRTLVGKTVGVVERNSGHLMLRDRADLTLKTFETAEQAILGLLSGSVDAVVYPDTVFQALARRIGVEDKIARAGSPLQEVPRGLRFRKDSSGLHARFSAAVTSFINSPDYSEIYTRWYGIPEPFWTSNRVFNSMLAVVAGLMVLFLAWRSYTLAGFNRQLRLSHLKLAGLNETLEQHVESRTRELSREIEERKRSQQDLETFFNQSQSLNLILEFDQNILRLNDAWYDFLGFDKDVFTERPFIDFVHPQDRERTAAAFTALIDGNGVDGFENRYICANGEIKYLRWSARTDPHRRLVYAVAQNMTEQKTAENALKLSAKVFTHTDEGIIITDAKGTILDINEAFTEITGYERDEVLGKNTNLLSSGRHDAAFYKQLWARLKTDGTWRGEIWNKRKTGEVFPEILTISAIEDEAGRTTNYIGLFVDITKMKAHERQLEHLARYDRLTGLPNRVLLSENMLQAMARARRQGRIIAIVFIDLDGFKAVNDTYGHAAGDELLVAVARRLMSVLRTEDTLARIGGDEFVAIITDLEDEKGCISTLDRILAAASREFRLGVATASVSASIGVTFYPQAAEIDVDQLERQADQAMYEAKLAGRNQYKFFDPEQDRKLAEYYAQVADAKTAIRTNAFRLFYQPKIKLRTREIIGYEALLRWQHPDKGMLTPAEFLPPVEKHPDVAIQLGNWVLDAALGQVEEWNKAGLDTSVSVNVSAIQITSNNFEETLQRHLAAHPGVAPRQLEIELLETDALSDLEKVSGIMRNCRKLDVKFALDDFGTGYSSLAYLKQLPIDTLKIDQGFVHDSLNNKQDQELLKLIISLGRVYNIDVLAEGVETTAHSELLQIQGCQHAQGYAFAKPMPAGDVIEWHRRWRDHAENSPVPHRALTGS